jgi:hypothetical protein
LAISFHTLNGVFDTINDYITNADKAEIIANVVAAIELPQLEEFRKRISKRHSVNV